MHHNHWTFGNGDHIEFLGGTGQPTVVTTGSQVATYEGCATISDGGGALLAYTDGVTLWDRSHSPVSGPPVSSPPLGGDPSSTSSAIIIPPAGGGTDYHVFAVADDLNASPDPVVHSTFTPSTGTVTPALPPTSLALPADNTERLAATSHADGDKYWVVTQTTGGGTFYTWLVEHDSAPDPAKTVTSTTSQHTAAAPGDVNQGYAKFSPDGTLFAWCGGPTNQISVHHFDSSNGQISDYFVIDSLKRPYGLEFSPNSNILYFTEGDAPDFGIRAFDISTAGNRLIVTRLDTVDKYSPTDRNDSVGALQLGPNGVIYGKVGLQNALLSITNPDRVSTSTVNPAAVTPLNPPTTRPRLDDGNWGLPTFVNIVAPGCKALTESVNGMLASKAKDKHNQLAPCASDDGDDGGVGNPGGGPDDGVFNPNIPIGTASSSSPDPFVPPGSQCRPFEHDAIEPSVSIHWGDSDCDGLESDDVETLLVTVCNPYDNISMSDVRIARIRLTNADSTVVDLLPDGTPSVETTPMGTFCFGTIEPCSCVTREFLVQTRGARHGEYKLHIEGLCLDVCLHTQKEACFKLEVCEDR